MTIGPESFLSAASADSSPARKNGKNAAALPAVAINRRRLTKFLTFVMRLSGSAGSLAPHPRRAPSLFRAWFPFKPALTVVMDLPSRMTFIPNFRFGPPACASYAPPALETTNLPPEQVPARSAGFRRLVFTRLTRPANHSPNDMAHPRLSTGARDGTKKRLRPLLTRPPSLEV